MAEETEAEAPNLEGPPTGEVAGEVVEEVTAAPAIAGERMTEPAATQTATPATTPDSPPTSEKSSSSGVASLSGNKFYTLIQSIQQNIEALNDASKLIEKINDRILFHTSTISPKEESSLIQKVASIIKKTNMKARDASRLIRQLRVETVKPTPVPGSETKSENEKSEEELAEESRDVGDKENICKTVTRSFTDELLLYQSAMQDFKNELKERLTKKVQTIRSDASEDYIDLSLRSESSRYALFREIMATDEKHMSEEDAKDLKDDIAEKYVVIAELSHGSAEMNKIFLALASAATKPPSLSSDNEDSGGDEDDDDGLGDGGSGRKAGRFSRTKRSQGTTSATNVMIDDLLGSRPTATGADPSTSEKNRDEGASSHQKKNRLFSFMSRHRRASTGTAKKLRFTMSEDGAKRRPSRANRWITMLLLATVGLAAIVGLVLLH